VNAPSNGLRRVTPELFAAQCDVPTRLARRYLRKHYPNRIQSDSSFGLTEYEVIETRTALHKLAPRYATGFTPEKRHR